MNRIVKDNINTQNHWDNVYTNTKHQITDPQKIRYQMIGINILNLPIEVVDLGCGTGMCDASLKSIRPNLKITGVDITSQTVSMPVFEKYIQADVTKTGLPDESFYYAISCEVLEHLDEPQKLVNEMYRLLRKFGKALLTTPLLNKLPSNEHVWEFSLDDVYDMFKKAGFANVYAFPWSSNGELADETGKIVGVVGSWDQIYCFAEKI